MIRSTVRRARRAHKCERCRRRIEVGELHREAVASPFHDDLDNHTWWRLRECADCARACGRPIAATTEGAT